MRKLTLELEGKLEACFATLTDDLAIKAIKSILRDHIYVERREGGRESNSPNFLEDESSLPPSDYKLEIAQEKEDKLEQILRLMNNLSTAINSGGIVARQSTGNNNSTSVYSNTNSSSTKEIDLSDLIGDAANILSNSGVELGSRKIEATEDTSSAAVNALMDLIK